MRIGVRRFVVCEILCLFILLVGVVVVVDGGGGGGVGTVGGANLVSFVCVEIETSSTCTELYSSTTAFFFWKLRFCTKGRIK